MAEESALREKFRRNVGNFIYREIQSKLGDSFPHPSSMPAERCDYEWIENDYAYKIKLPYKDSYIWMGPRALFSEDRGRIPRYQILVNINWSSFKNKGKIDRIDKAFTVSNNEEYTTKEFEKTEKEIITHLFKQIHDYLKKDYW